MIKKTFIKTANIIKTSTLLLLILIMSIITMDADNGSLTSFIVIFIIYLIIFNLIKKYIFKSKRRS